MLGLLKSFASLHLWTLFQKWIHQANKRLLKPYSVSKKIKTDYFGTKMEIFGHDQNIGFPKKFFLCDVEPSRSHFQIWINQAKKAYFSHTWCPKNENGLILVKKLRYMDLIKTLVHMKSFAFVMLSILGNFFQKWIEPANNS